MGCLHLAPPYRYHLATGQMPIIRESQHAYFYSYIIQWSWTCIIISRSTHDITSTMITSVIMAATLGILLIATLSGCHVQSQCRTTDTCELQNIHAISETYTLIPLIDIYPASCPGFCSQHAECIAATYDPTTEECQLHQADAEGAPCTTLTAKIGSTFPMMKLPGIPCPKVRRNC